MHTKIQWVSSPCEVVIKSLFKTVYHCSVFTKACFTPLRAMNKGGVSWVQVLTACAGE